jgi:hypothetical protein
MKVILAILVGLVFLATVSCTKTNNVTTTIRDTTVVKDTTVIRDTVYEKNPRNPIVGLWVGAYKWVGGNPADSFYYSFAVQANGTVITTSIANGASASTAGPWDLNGTSFTASATELAPTTSTPKIVVTLTATYDSVAGTLVGGATYSAVNPNATYILHRVP